MHGEQGGSLRSSHRSSAVAGSQPCQAVSSRWWEPFLPSKGSGSSGSPRCQGGQQRCPKHALAPCRTSATRLQVMGSLWDAELLPACTPVCQRHRSRPSEPGAHPCAAVRMLEPRWGCGLLPIHPSTREPCWISSLGQLVWL